MVGSDFISSAAHVRKKLEDVVCHLDITTAAIRTVIAAIPHEDCVLDERVARVLRSAAVGTIFEQMECVSDVLRALRQLDDEARAAARRVII